MNSCSKGKRGEREARDLLMACGVTARRGQQHSGSPDSPDVVSGLAWVHWEVKRVEALHLYPAIGQAERDASPGQVPIVLHKANGKRWVALLDAERLIGILTELDAARRAKDAGLCGKA